jgi:hypothetical protein
MKPIYAGVKIGTITIFVTLLSASITQATINPEEFRTRTPEAPCTWLTWDW